MHLVCTLMIPYGPRSPEKLYEYLRFLESAAALPGHNASDLRLEIRITN